MMKRCLTKNEGDLTREEKTHKNINHSVELVEQIQVEKRRKIKKKRGGKKEEGKEREGGEGKRKKKWIENKYQEQNQEQKEQINGLTMTRVSINQTE